MILARYDIEIEYCESRAARMGFCSRAFRAVAFVSGTLSILLIAVYAISPGISKAEVQVLFGFDYSVLATILFILAGIFLLLNLVFQLKKRYGRWKGKAHKNRIMRTDFDIEFLRNYSGKPLKKTDPQMFDEAKRLADNNFKTDKQMILSVRMD